MGDLENEMAELFAQATDQVMVKNLLCRNVVGVERWERPKIQSLVISFTYVLSSSPYCARTHLSCFRVRCTANVATRPITHATNAPFARLWTNVARTGNTDNLSFSHNYGLCASLVSEYAEACRALWGPIGPLP